MEQDPQEIVRPAGRAGGAPPPASAAGAPADALREAGRDHALLTRMATGEPQALAELFDRHAPQLLGVALRILCSREDAEDLVHDVFLEAWGKAASFDPERGGVRTWLLVRLRSRAIDRARSLAVARRHAVAEACGSDAPPLRTEAGVGPDHLRARRALAALSAPQRSVVELAYFEGLTQREIAERCGIPIGTVKSRLALAIENLRKALLGGAGDA